MPATSTQSTIVSVLLYPEEERRALGFRPNEAELVKVPTSFDGSRQMLISSLLTVIAKQYPKFASQHVESCHVARASDSGGHPELLPRDARLFPGDTINIHIVPRAPDGRSDTAAHKKREVKSYDILSKPLIQTLCDFSPPADGWPAPLPPTTVLLAERGFAQKHAQSKLLVAGTPCDAEAHTAPDGPLARLPA